jgi:hypothetical protein
MVVPPHCGAVGRILSYAVADDGDARGIVIGCVFWHRSAGQPIIHAALAVAS